MPAAVLLRARDVDLVDDYITAMKAIGHRTGRSTVQAAKSFCAKAERAGGWDKMTRARQLDAVHKARAFASWLMVTGQLTVDADVLGRLDLRLGGVAANYCQEAHAWFVAACERLGTRPADVSIQWNALVKVTAVTGTPPDRVGDADFIAARAAIVAAYRARDLPESGRNMASHFHRLQLTLFHAGRVTSLARTTKDPPVSVTGWSAVAPAFADAACRYVAQVDLSLRPATVKHIEHDLREFGTWLAEAHPEVSSCAELERSHIEGYKSWVAVKHGRYTSKPLNRVSIKNRLINLHCFFDRITEWGYPNPPQRPLIFAGDLPIVDKPLPALPRRRGGHQAPASVAGRPRSAVASHRGAVGPHRDPQERAARPHRRRCRPDRLRVLAADPRRQAPQRPLHPAAPPAQRDARRLDRQPSTHRAALRPAPARTQPTRHLAAGLQRAEPPEPATPASATSPPTSSDTPWPPRPSTEA